MPEKKDEPFAFKLRVVGEHNIGKTSLMKEYANSFFEEGYQITLSEKTKKM